MLKEMLEDYVPVLLHVIVAVGFATVTLLANLVLGRAGKRTAAKDAAYECGVVPEPGPPAALQREGLFGGDAIHSLRY